MATTSIIGTKVVFSNSGAAVSETYYTSDVTLDIIRYFDVLAQDGGGKGKFLWSIGTSQISASGWTTQGAISVPTELLAQDTSYNIDSGLYRSALGANIFLTGATGLVGYDMSAMSAATKLQIDNLAVSQSITDSFDYAIRLGNGTLSWNTVRVVINGAPASIAVTGGYVVENQNVGYDGKLTDIESLSVRAASGDATSFTIAPKSAGTLGAITGLGGVLNADGSYTFLAGTGAFTYAVSNQAVLATHLGYGESQKEWFTITTANGTTADFYETVDGNINAPVVTASAAQASIKQGASVGLNISATDNDDNARLTYTIAGVPAGSILSSAADPGGVAYDPGTQSWTVAAGALGDLTLTLGPQFTQQIGLTVTVINTEANPSNPNDVASATTTASIDIAVSGGTFEVGSGSTLVGADLGSGGTEIVRSGGLATDTTVSGGGFQDVFGTTSGTVVGDGGRQTVEAGGIASGTIINSGGTEIVGSGGLDIGATISGGGFQDLFGSASGALLLGGGSQTVERGGLAQGTLLDDAAVQTVFGSAIGTTVSATDTQLVEAGGVASGTIISSGGSEIVHSGGLTVDTTIAGGTLELSEGATASGTITFSASGGVLQVDGSAMPAIPIVGFARGDSIDLRSLAPNAGNSVTFDSATGALTVSGTVTETVTLSGVQSGATFTLAADGQGGTLVEEAPPPRTYTYTILDAPGTYPHFSGIYGTNVTAISPTGSVTGRGSGNFFSIQLSSSMAAATPTSAIWAPVIIPKPSTPLARSQGLTPTTRASTVFSSMGAATSP